MPRWLGYHTVLNTVLNVGSASRKRYYYFNDGSSLDMVTLPNMTSNRLTNFESQGGCQWIYNYGMTIPNNKPCPDLLWSDVNFANYIPVNTDTNACYVLYFCFFFVFFLYFFLCVLFWSLNVTWK